MQKESERARERDGERQTEREKGEDAGRTEREKGVNACYGLGGSQTSVPGLGRSALDSLRVSSCILEGKVS